MTLIFHGAESPPGFVLGDILPSKSSNLSPEFWNTLTMWYVSSPSGVTTHYARRIMVKAMSDLIEIRTHLLPFAALVEPPKLDERLLRVVDIGLHVNRL